MNLPGPPAGYQCATDPLNPPILSFAKILCAEDRSCQSMEITVNNLRQVNVI